MYLVGAAHPHKTDSQFRQGAINPGKSNVLSAWGQGFVRRELCVENPQWGRPSACDGLVGRPVGLRSPRSL
jgi:hypothetical protein